MQRVLQHAWKTRIVAFQRLACASSHGMQTSAIQSANGGKEPETPLLQSIRQRIMVRGGPLSIAEYMQETLTNPSSGFYMRSDVFGHSGHFVTSPEVSQMFGEMVAIWSLVTWMHMGQPKPLRLVELGPGRGTLMADLLRGASSFPDFASALEVDLVELSPAMRAKQWMALDCTASPQTQQAEQQAQRQPPPTEPAPAANDVAASDSSSRDGGSTASSSGHGRLQQPAVAESGILPGCKVRWHASLDAVPREGPPAIFIAHEFFDALPVHQFVRDPARGWLEKMVDLADEEEAAGPGREMQVAARAGPGRGVQQVGRPVGVIGSDSPGSSGRGIVVDDGAAASSSAGSLQPPATVGVLSRGSHLPGQPAMQHSQQGAPSTAAASTAQVQHSQGEASTGQSSEQDPHHLRLVLSPRPTPASDLLVQRRLEALGQEAAEKLTAIEISAHGMATAEQLALRIGQHGGAALIIDYGRDSPYTDSLAAIRAHKGVHMLSQPGTADLSAWVDFSALRQGAEGSGAAVRVHGPVPQGQLLLSLGIQARLQALAQLGTQQQAEALLAGYKRLVEGGADGMGQTYQALAITQQGMPVPVGFEGFEAPAPQGPECTA